MIGPRFGRLLACAMLTYGIAQSDLHAQQTPHEAEVLVAINGQLPLIKTAEQNGFFTNPFIGRIQYQAVTNGVQSLSVFLESVSEDRAHDDLYAFGASQAFDAHIVESVHMTSLGLEMIRTLVVAGDLRIAAGIDIGFGLGRPSITVTGKTNDSTFTVQSLSTWDGLLGAALVRARYTIAHSKDWDIGLILTGRYWTFVTMGPLSDAVDVYNGPAFRSVHDLGYLFGLSVGF